MLRIHDEILIRAPAETVWALLTHRAHRDAWDPLFATIEGEIAEGMRLSVRLREGMRFRPRVTRVETGRLLEWVGRLPVPGLLSGRHRFELTKTPAGTRFVNTEIFRGLLVPLLSGFLGRNRASFAAFDAALKAEAERMTGAETTPGSPAGSSGADGSG
jgi:hypothetical protein